MMPLGRCVLALAMLFPTHLATAASRIDSAVGYLWQAELTGPTQKCKIPSRIRFAAADAIITGEIKIGRKLYFPKGRLEDNRNVVISLIRFYGDEEPLLSLNAMADGTWNGRWTTLDKGCAGKVRVVPRR
jgi:hypothetical protein